MRWSLTNSRVSLVFNPSAWMVISTKFSRHTFYFCYGSWPVWTGTMSRNVYHMRRVATREEKMAWYVLSDFYVRHDVGAEVYLSSKDIDLPGDPQFAAPTANYSMGMYEAHGGLLFARVHGKDSPKPGCTILARTHPVPSSTPSAALRDR